MAVPKSYRTIEEFEREVLKPQFKIGFSFDDLTHETSFGESDMLFDDTFDAYDPKERDSDD
jgi:hypothetical protein